MSAGDFEVELARVNLETAEDMRVVTAAEIVTWLRARAAIGTPEAVVAVERAAAAMGRARRFLALAEGAAHG